MNFHPIHGYQNVLQSSQTLAAFLWSMFSIPVSSNFVMSLPLPRTPLALVFSQTIINTLFIIWRIRDCDTIIYFVSSEGNFRYLDNHVLSFSALEPWPHRKPDLSSGLKLVATSDFAHGDLQGNLTVNVWSGKLSVIIQYQAQLSRPFWNSL